MIHSSRVRTELLLIALLPCAPSRILPSSSKNSCSNTNATPIPASPPATQIDFPRLRCGPMNEITRGRTSCIKTCCPRFPGARCTRSTSDEFSLSPCASSGRAAPLMGRSTSGGGWLSVLSGGASDSSTITNMVSPCRRVSDAPGRSRGKSDTAHNSTRPPTFNTGVGSVRHTAPSDSPLPVPCSAFRALATSCATSASSPSRGHASNPTRCRQNSCGVKPCANVNHS